jgi:hypothetical protein
MAPASMLPIGVPVRGQHLHQQLDSLQPLRLQARGEFQRESY